MEHIINTCLFRDSGMPDPDLDKDTKWEGEKFWLLFFVHNFFAIFLKDIIEKLE